MTPVPHPQEALPHWLPKEASRIPVACSAFLILASFPPCLAPSLPYQHFSWNHLSVCSLSLGLHLGTSGENIIISTSLSLKLSISPDFLCTSHSKPPTAPTQQSSAPEKMAEPCQLTLPRFSACILNPTLAHHCCSEFLTRSFSLCPEATSSNCYY